MIHICTGVVVAYLLGAIPTGYIFVRFFKKKDIRTVGSGNIGATNVFRIGGPLMGLVVLLLDGLKGLLSVTYVASICYHAPSIIDLGLFKIILALAAICGHIWTIFLGFKGGKGVATSAGVFIGLAPKALLVCAVIWVIIFAITRYVSLASIISSAVFPVATYLLQYPREFFIFSILAAVFIIYKHKSNIFRLLHHSENRISFKR